MGKLLLFFLHLFLVSNIKEKSADDFTLFFSIHYLEFLILETHIPDRFQLELDDSDDLLIHDDPHHQFLLDSLEGIGILHRNSQLFTPE